jgi:predicted Rossmann-fold nucleotide-binding protein
VWRKHFNRLILPIGKREIAPEGGIECVCGGGGEGEMEIPMAVEYVGAEFLHPPSFSLGPSTD